MLELREIEGLRVLYIGEHGADEAMSQYSMPKELVINWVSFPTLSETLAGLSENPAIAFNLNLVVFHIHALAEEPHHARDILSYAPVAARVLVYESPTDRFLMDMKPLFDMTWARPDVGVVRPEVLYWFRAGMMGTLRAFTQAPTAFVFVHRRSGAVLSANEAALRVLEREGFEGGVVNDLMALPGEALQSDDWRGRIELSEHGDQVLGVTVRSLEEVWLFISLRDITSIQASREQQRQDDGRMILGRAAAVLAHEVSNPLASIKSTLQLIGSGNFSRKQIEDYISRALREIERLSTIVKSYLSIVRPPSKFDEVWGLKELIETSFVYMDDYLATVGVDCEIQPIDPAIQVYFGADQFKQILWNIAKNAVDSMLKSRTKSPKVTIGVLRPSKDSISIYFDDNGEGIEEAIAEKVFEPYFTSKGGAGTGLGLTICRMLASRYKGSLILKNNAEGGARAVLTMRMAET
ncbi:sensor histidine kinase [Haliangium ochraceum]|uniref:histidine kinase n=1 Tax=Haliangium ochraceum (strain DSM 14365 / JCM 11303 / SMP-2) TaxID=502025 RepID=D0LUG9_HALO1|nr:ATP-binding protein [Haliangium ochraceum]ACY19292.1 histidine kinase [Haliangium ochraceum DSM 14365]